MEIEYVKCWRCHKFVDNKKATDISDTVFKEEAGLFKLIFAGFFSKHTILCIDCIKRHNKRIDTNRLGR